ncbi:DUF6940 family protein [Fodinibius saliphilus]|uniref:DUF6940 family protein n=1 Tax=Fodinibius saliphilus TaxID=1920650 RepID=UPI001BB0F9AC|nr:hypothetical protein [Fodinibius saliphilus]
MSLLRQSETFRIFFIKLLSEVPFRAYHWETPAVTRNTIGHLFEFVITNSQSIDLPPNPGPFRSYFNETYAREGITVFDNLGGDAKLIAPEPIGENLNYSHIGVFTEQAPMDQQHNFWKIVGEVTEEEISDEPIWLNTAGGGVCWLHVRLDSRPKYYRYDGYRDF